MKDDITHRENESGDDAIAAGSIWKNERTREEVPQAEWRRRCRSCAIGGEPRRAVSRRTFRRLGGSGFANEEAGMICGLLLVGFIGVLIASCGDRRRDSNREVSHDGPPPNPVILTPKAEDGVPEEKATENSWPEDDPSRDDSRQLRAYFGEYRGDVSAALDWLLERQNNADGQAGLYGLGAMIGASAPDQIGPIAERITNVIAKQKFVSRAVRSWGRKKPIDAAEWALGHPHTFLSYDLARDDAASLFISASDYERAGSIINEMEMPNRDSLRKLVKFWGVDDPTAFVQWLNESSNNMVVEQGVYQLAQKWITSDRHAAEQWANSQEDTVLRGIAYDGIASALAKIDPETAWKYALGIEDVKRQLTLMRRMLSRNIDKRKLVRGWITKSSSGKEIPQVVEQLLVEQGL